MVASAPAVFCVAIGSMRGGKFCFRTQHYHLDATHAFERSSMGRLCVFKVLEEGDSFWSRRSSGEKVVLVPAGPCVCFNVYSETGRLMPSKYCVSRVCGTSFNIFMQSYILYAIYLCFFRRQNVSDRL